MRAENSEELWETHRELVVLRFPRVLHGHFGSSEGQRASIAGGTWKRHPAVHLRTSSSSSSSCSLQITAAAPTYVVFLSFSGRVCWPARWRLHGVCVLLCLWKTESQQQQCPGSVNTFPPAVCFRWEQWFTWRQQQAEERERVRGAGGVRESKGREGREGGRERCNTATEDATQASPTVRLSVRPSVESARPPCVVPEDKPSKICVIFILLLH